VDFVGQGTPVAIRGRNDDGSWLAVRSPAQSEGWMSARYVSLRRDEASIPTLATPTSPPTLTPTPEPLDPAQALVLAPPAVAQGDPVLVRLRAEGAAQVIAALGETTLPLLRTGPDTYVGLLGVPVETNPGQHAVHVTAVNAEGEPHAQSVTLLVHHAVFEEESITLDEDTQHLLEPSVAEAETSRLQTEVWSVVTPDRWWSGSWTVPVTGSISSTFGAHRSYNDSEEIKRHTGVDFRGGPSTPVNAPARGRVGLAEPLDVRGNTVWLDHGWGVHSGYFHLTDIAVEPGAIVEQGELLGTIGATGRTTGPHLHWEVRVHGVPVQPLQWLLTDPGAVP
jgi:murein DD-endopeptidase MepM/ murein hydrolase activator NlpD